MQEEVRERQTKSLSLTNMEAGDRWPESDSLNLLWRQSKVTCVYFEQAGDYTRIVHPKQDYTPPAASQAWIRRMERHSKITPGSTFLFSRREVRSGASRRRRRTSSLKGLQPRAFILVIWVFHAQWLMGYCSASCNEVFVFHENKRNLVCWHMFDSKVKG